MLQSDCSIVSSHSWQLPAAFTFSLSVQCLCSLLLSRHVVSSMKMSRYQKHLCAFWQTAVDSRQCADAVLPEALCRHKALSGGAHIIHNGKLWLVSRHAAVGTGVLCHDWLDCVPGMLVTSHDS